MAKLKKCTVAVVMGDIVSSSHHEDIHKLFKDFNKQVELANETFKSKIASPLTITLGDEFQGLISKLSDGLVVLHSLRLNFLEEGIKVRFVLGEVEGLTSINSLKAWNMMGHGLPEARKKLNEEVRDNAYRFSLPKHKEIEILMDSIGMSLTHIEDNWTESQRRYVLEVFNHPKLSKSEIAKKLHISVNSLYKVLRSSNYRLYQDQFESIKKVLEQLDFSHLSFQVAQGGR